MNIEKEQVIDGYLFSTNKSRLNINYIHAFLSIQSYWAKGVRLEIVKRSIAYSLAVGVYHNEKQIGFARVITDYTTFGYLADVFVEEAYRGRGISKNLVSFIFTLEELTELRRFMLATRDAHSLYARVGFKPLKNPEYFMEKHDPNIYLNAQTH
jgi:GNAT superfamily N-acetyltransferase